jgi:Holliday junction resolvase RusA-like endonuclease
MRDEDERCLKTDPVKRCHLSSSDPFLDLTFILPRPKNLMRKSHPEGRIPHTKRPDRDNLVKVTQDGLSAAGFWVDDVQVFDGRVAKYYAERGG